MKIESDFEQTDLASYVENQPFIDSSGTLAYDQESQVLFTEKFNNYIKDLCNTSDIKHSELIQASKSANESKEMIANLKLEKIGIYSKNCDLDPVLQKLLNRITKMVELDLKNNDFFDTEFSSKFQS